MDKSLTDYEVQKVAGPGTRVFLYPNIAKIKHINELVSDDKPNAIILYQMVDDPQTKSVSGHWTCLKKINNTIIYFDSYGNVVDYPLQVLGKGYRIMTDQLFKKLSFLLGDSPYDIHYNEHKYQIKKPGINTCGRHCAFFLNSGLDENHYFEMMNKAKNDLGYKNYDEMIVDLTNDLL